MRVIEANGFGGPQVLEATTRPDPQPTAGRVRVSVAATTVNPADAVTRAGVLAHFTPDLPTRFVLGWDLAGTVIEDAEGFAAGDRVAGMIPWFELGDGEGAYAEIVSAEPAWIAKVPDSLTDVVAATVPLNGLTARQAVGLLQLQPGQTLAVTGASGAVGGFAVQIAGAAGVHVVAVASSGDREHVATLGAKEVVERVPGADLTEAIREVAPGGVDALLDAGGGGATLLGAVRDGGTFAAVSGVPPESERGIRIARVEVTPNAGQLQTLLDDVAAGRLATRVAGTLPLAEAADAHRRVEAGGFQGKLVLTTGA